MENSEWHPKASDSKDKEDRVAIPFGKVMMEKMSLEIKPKDEDLFTSQMVIDVDTFKNELAEDEFPLAFEDQTLDETDSKITSEEPTMSFYLLTSINIKK